MNTQIVSHWKLAYKTFKTAVKVTLSIFPRMNRANFYDLKVDRKLETQRDAFKILKIDEIKFPKHKSPAITLIEYIDGQIKLATTLREKELLQGVMKKYLKVYGVSKADLDGGYFEKKKKAVENKVLSINQR